MTLQAIIERTVNAIKQLPEARAKEISDFADFVFKRFEEEQLTKGMQTLVTDSQTFDFLNEDEELYSEADLKESYNAKG